MKYKLDSDGMRKVLALLPDSVVFCFACPHPNLFSFGSRVTRRRRELTDTLSDTPGSWHRPFNKHEGNTWK